MIVIMLGMHRSGTSCLAGCLEECGLHLGDVNRSAPHNLKGNREHPAIMRFQEALFIRRDRSWGNPPQTMIISEKERSEFSNISSSFEECPHWGFKDPRTLFTLDTWLELFGQQAVALVGTFRHPLAVAKSLQNRNQFPLKKGLGLWHRYNCKLLDYCSQLPITLIDFDLSSSRYQERLTKISKQLGLPSTPENFYATELINQAPSKTPVDDERIAIVYEQLLAQGARSVH